VEPSTVHVSSSSPSTPAASTRRVATLAYISAALTALWPLVLGTFIVVDYLPGHEPHPHRGPDPLQSRLIGVAALVAVAGVLSAIAAIVSILVAHRRLRGLYLAVPALLLSTLWLFLTAAAAFGLTMSAF
jgi:hypothetical protein